MYNKNNVRAFRKAVGELKRGEQVYINAIALSIGGVDQLREYIKDKTLIPVREEVEKRYADVDSIMSGSVIFPQMSYIKQ